MFISQETWYEAVRKKFLSKAGEISYSNRPINGEIICNNKGGKVLGTKYDQSRLYKSVN